jgi:hypothetical protein
MFALGLLTMARAWTTLRQQDQTYNHNLKERTLQNISNEQPRKLLGESRRPRNHPLLQSTHQRTRVKMKNIAIIGSRAISHPIIRETAEKAVLAGHHISTGCCIGADASVITGASAANPKSLRIFAAFGPDGHGSCGLSNPEILNPKNEWNISWWSGGGFWLPLRARLAKRADACIDSADFVIAAFQDGPSVGTIRACEHALSLGLSIAVLNIGTPPEPRQGSYTPNTQLPSWLPPDTLRIDPDQYQF